MTDRPGAYPDTSTRLRLPSRSVITEVRPRELDGAERREHIPALVAHAISSALVRRERNEGAEMLATPAAAAHQVNAGTDAHARREDTIECLHGSRDRRDELPLRLRDRLFPHINE